MLRNPHHLVYVVLSSIFSTAFGVINIITIYVFWHKFRLSTLTLIVMVNICMCDIFVCLISNTFYVANLSHPVYDWSTGAVGCKLFKFLTMLTCVAQIYFLCVLNADRLRRLVYSTKKQWNRRHGVIFVSFGWIAATVLCLPRLIHFNEAKIPKDTENNTDEVSFTCKPSNLDDKAFVISTLVTFIVAYAIPLCYILYTLVMSQIYMWRRRKQIHFSTMSNIVTKMNRRIALTFNLTGALFMLIWTPFFILSLLDVFSISKTNKGINFSLRCTLLILGSAKPLIYMICLDKFRHSFSCSTYAQSKTDSDASDAADKSRELQEKTKMQITAITKMNIESNA